MKTLRTMAAVLALSLAVFGLTGCTDTGDCDDAAGHSTVTVAAAAHFADGKGPGGKSGKSKPKVGKVHGSDDCEDDD